MRGKMWQKLASHLGQHTIQWCASEAHRSSSWNSSKINAYEGPQGKGRTWHSVLQKTPDARASQFDETAVEAVTENAAERDRMRLGITWTVLVLGVVLIVIGLMHFSLAALPEPGPVETRMANQAKQFVIRRATRQGIPPRPVDANASVQTGG